MREKSTVITAAQADTDGLEHTGLQEDLNVHCYEGIAPFIEDDLCRLYSNVHSSLAHLRVYGGLDEITHTYIARHARQSMAIFLLRIEGSSAKVINEGMRLDELALNRFADHIFTAFPDVASISFQAVETQVRNLARPFQLAPCTAEMAIPLPSSVDAYLESLGRNMRRNLRRYMDKLRSKYPSFQYQVFEREAIDAQLVRSVMDLNRARIASKNQVYSIDHEEEKIIALARACGVVGVGTIDGRVCCGTIGYRVGDRFFFKVNGHDPAYNPWSLGILGCYLMIRTCIERGCHEANLMWNEYEYKLALGAKRRDLERLVIYRSAWQMLAQARRAAAFKRDALRHHAVSLLEKSDKPDQLNRVEQAVLRMLLLARSLKRRVAP